ncbi:hypothetical protein ACJZ2D_013452 [Fusarium nematophilum]
MAPSSSRPSGSWSPAPYGRTCTGCSRAKCKCFYRPEESKCERCQRLKLSCESSAGVRKRRTQASASPQPNNSRLEKLDDIASLLRPQNIQGRSQVDANAYSTAGPQLLSVSENTPSTLGPPPDYSISASPAPEYNPDVAIDTTSGEVDLLRPTQPGPDPSMPIIFGDMAIHALSDRIAGEHLNTFRRSFLPIFPAMHLPSILRSSDLRQQKPFTWLVVMALSTKQTSQQFAMEETIWQVISKRIVWEQLANLDLLIGLICFASWSHYFKKDKPFMAMLSQIAVSLAFELNLQHDPPQKPSRRSKYGREIAEDAPSPKTRSLEERRTLLALFHLSSSTWTAYKKTEPLPWTPYMDECLAILFEGKETHLDTLLAAQIKCQLITRQLDHISLDDKGPSTILINALSRELSEVQQTLPANVLSERSTQLYLSNTDLTITKLLIGKPQTTPTNIQRIQHLESVLTTAEAWLALFMDMPLSDMVGLSVDLFTQYLTCMVVLFKLVTVNEPGWDVEEVRKRADVLELLDRSCDIVKDVPAALGLVDAPGPRRGLFFKMAGLLTAIKTLMISEMKEKCPSQWDATADPVDNVEFSEGFLESLAEEPWMADIFEGSWEGLYEGSLDPSSLMTG